MKGMIMKRAKLLAGIPVAFALAAFLAAADQALYDENADAHKQIAAAVAEARKGRKNVVLVFGANW